MLQLNPKEKKQGELFTNLNTSYVTVKQRKRYKLYDYCQNLNTSYVTVKRTIMCME